MELLIGYYQIVNPDVRWPPHMRMILDKLIRLELAMRRLK